MKKIKIIYKFLLVLLFISAVPIIIVGSRLTKINREGLEDVILELHTREALAIAEQIGDHMRNLNEKIGFVISAHGEGTINWTLTSQILQSLIASSPEFRTVSGVNLKGAELTKVFHPDLADKVKLENRSDDETFIEALASGRYSVSSVYYEEDHPQINIVYPFTSDIYLYIQTSLKDLSDRVRSTSIGSTGYAYIIESSGRLILHPDSGLAKEGTDFSDSPLVQEVMSRRLVGSKEYLTSDGRAVVGAYAPASALGWGVVIEQDKDEAYFTVEEMRKSAKILLLFAIVFAILIGYFLAQYITGPILKLTGAARKISEGSFDVEEISSWLNSVKLKDELAELASTFITMTTDLERYSDMQADKLNAFLFSINDGIIMTDYSGRVVMANRMVTPLLNLPYDEELSGKNIKDIIQRKEIEESLEEVKTSEGTIVREIEIPDLRDPKVLRLDTSLVSKQVGASGAVTVIRDVTLEKQLEKMKEDFLHSITHDLRSPMTSIRGFLEFLIDGTAGELNEQQIEFLHIIDDSSKRLLNMINNILDVAKMESGTMPLNREEIDLAGEVRDALKSLEGQAVKDNIEMIMQEENKIGPIMADPGLIHRVIINLVSNSLKFTPEGGLISVSIEDFTDEVEVAVRDTGQGMPEEYVDKIFEKFEQVKGSAGKRKGTGLGLTITRLIIEAHGGRIWAESKLGEGSKFMFRIPRDIPVAEDKNP